ncbi:MAG: hypothetical protein GY866_42775 [Proteobacteria bacterium]|nr:hypothetical protein [Pseudomonadota bacterium]
MENRLLEELYHIDRDFHDRGIFLNLSGPLSHDLMVEMGDLMKTKMKLEGFNISTILNAFSVLVELNQNIIHYSAEKISDKNPAENKEGTGCGIISMGRENGSYFLLSGNLIENRKVGKLCDQLDALIKMNKEELKKHYKIKRRQDADNESKGAGLGLIEMARKASRPLEYKFQKIDDTHSFFSLKTVI